VPTLVRCRHDQQLHSRLAHKLQCKNGHESRGEALTTCQARRALREQRYVHSFQHLILAFLVDFELARPQQLVYNMLTLLHLGSLIALEL
jgi:hypothetical protein